MLSDFQRWLIRSGARNVRREIGGQVRRTLGGGRADTGDIWDMATSEIPPEVGESPECQWCPVCRAARAMRESNPGLSDHLSTAGDVVSSAVQEAFKAFDSVLNRSGSSRSAGNAGDASTEGQDGWAQARDQWAAEHGARMPDGGVWPTRPPTSRPSDADSESLAPDPDSSSPEADVQSDSVEPDVQSDSVVPDAQAETGAPDAQAETGAPDAHAEGHELNDEPGGSDEPHDRG
jgi:hypothetical protein